MVWVLLSTFALALGLAVTWWLHRYSRIEPRISGAQASAGPLAPLVSIIIPARNEARNIHRCVGAALAQAYPHFEVIVVDDRSTDNTPQILAGLAARNPRLRVLPGEPLPRGWAGKPHALHQGQQLARGEWLCFVDADTFLRPPALAAALAAAQASGADLFTMLTDQVLHSFWEKVVMPLVFNALAVGFPPERVNDPRRPEAIANGQFILIRRAIYDAVGGHAALRASIAEDKELAERVKRAGFRLLLVDGREVAETRMYTSLREMWEGWTKNIFIGLRGRRALLVLGIFVGLVGALFLPAWPVAGLLWLARGGGAAAAVVAAEAALLWAYLLAWRTAAARAFGIAPIYALTLPLGALVFTAMMLASTVRVLSGKGVTWKGRIYK